jgi:hypothetical protein
MGFFDWLFGSSEPKRNIRKRVFISFAIEDIEYRNYLVEQARKTHSPFDLIDMSAKRAWKESEWRSRCRTKIKGCDCMIVLLSHNTYHSNGVKWEVKCAKEARIPIRGMYIKKNEQVNLPPELKGTKKMAWSWDNLADFLN